MTITATSSTGPRSHGSCCWRGRWTWPRRRSASSPCRRQPASPYLALWNRLADFDPADLDAAFAGRVGGQGDADAHPTLYAVHADDWPEFHNAMVPRLRGRVIGCTTFASDREWAVHRSNADALAASLLATFVAPPAHRRRDPGHGSKPGSWWSGRRELWWALRTFAPVNSTPRLAIRGRTTARTSFVAAGTQPTSSDKGEADEALQTLDLALPGGLRAGFGRRHGALRHGGALPRSAPRCAAWAAGWSSWTGPDGRRAVRRPRRSHGRTPDTPGPAAAPPDVGQHPAGVRRPNPPHPAGAPRRHRHDRTGTSCRPCWSTGTSPGCGAPSTAPSRPRRSVACAADDWEGLAAEAQGPTGVARRSTSPGPTAATTAGGPTYPEPRSDCSPRSGRAEIRPATCERGSR